MPKYPATDIRKPSDIPEFARRNFWFDAAGFTGDKLNPPLKGNRLADVVIVGGGFTGLASARK